MKWFVTLRLLTAMSPYGDGVLLDAPFSAPGFTLRFACGEKPAPTYTLSPDDPIDADVPLAKVDALKDLRAGAYHHGDGVATVCIDLGKGRCALDGFGLKK